MSYVGTAPHMSCMETLEAVRSLVTVETVLSMTEIENADLIASAKVRGWNLVVKKDEVAVGDSVVYFEIDSHLPLSDPRFAFLEPRGSKTFNGVHGHVLKSARMRGVYSQGLAMPAALFPELETLAEGENLATVLGVTKYEKPIPDEISGKVSGEFPTRFAPRTGAERVQNLTDVYSQLRETYDWIATEKVDGCLLHSSPILMADGSSKMIKNIVVGDMVMGFEDGAMVPTPVLNTFRNGLTNDWLCVRGSRLSRGRGSADFSIKATPNHKFWVEGHGYRPAGELRAGDILLCTHSDLTLTSTQKSILLGILLGDGSLVRGAETAAVAWSHSADQEDYLVWSINALGSIARRSGSGTSGYGSEMVRAMTLRSPGIADVFEDFDKPGGHLPDRVADMLTPLALAYWYMDDGSLMHAEGQEDRATISTHSFNEEAQKTLRLGLQRLGINSSSQSSSKGSFLRINADSADLMFSMIAPYIPPSMQYKLPSYYRGCPGWVPPHTAGFKEAVGPVMVTSVEQYLPVNSRDGSLGKRMKFDIETGTHNFFVSRILVHNSSTTFINDGGTLRVAGREWEFSAPSSPADATVPWKIAAEYSILDRLPIGYTVQGELYGAGVLAKNTLKETGKKFLAFNVLRDGVFVPRSEWPAAIEEIGTPVLDLELPATVEEALAQVEGMKSVLNPAVMAEGIVWHNTAGARIPELQGRTGMKAINNKWLVKHS